MDLPGNPYLLEKRDPVNVSILTPCLNASAFLPDAIASVRNQGDQIEHIVVDGGSLDGTVEILKSETWPGLKTVSAWNWVAIRRNTR